MTVKKLLAYALLLSFFVVWTPRDLWHDCDNTHESSRQHDPQEVHFEKGHCFVCDFDLYTADMPVWLDFRFAAPVYAAETILFPAHASRSVEHTQLRGPPAIA